MVGGLLGGLDERHDFNRFLALDRRWATRKELGDLQDQGFVAFVLGIIFQKVVAKDGQSIALGAGADSSKHSDPAIVPFADDQICAFGFGPGDLLASGAHGGIEGFDAMDAVPSQIGVMGFERARAPGLCAEDFAIGVFAVPVDGGGEPQGRGGKPGCFEVFGELGDGDRIGKIGSQGLIDKDAFAGHEDRVGLLEVLAAIEAIEDDRIDFSEKIVDRVYDLDSLGLKLFGVVWDSIDARGQVGATAWERSDDFQSRHWA